MPVETNQAFFDEARKRSKAPIYLYTIYDYDGAGTDKHLAGYDIDVTFGDPPITYDKFPITHSEITENAKGEIDTIKLQVSNISRLIEYYLQQYDLRGKKVSIKMVFANKLDDPDCYIEFCDNIDSYTSNVKDVVFNLMSKLDVFFVTLPGRTFRRSRCDSTFKSTECGYSGAETECNHTRQRCKELGNGPRFSACPSVPGLRTFS